MAASVNANINVLVNTAQATAQLKSLQAQIATTNRAIGAGGGAAAAQQAALTKALMDGANASRMWNARVVPMATATQQFTDALDRGKMSLGQYTRYAASQLPGMGRVFRREFDMMSRVAEQNVRRMNSQYVSLGNNAAGAAQAMSLMPTALNKQAAATQIATQRQMMMNRMIDLGSTKLLNWGKNTQWAGRQLMVGFSIPLAMMGAAAAKAFKEIDKAEISFKRVYGNLETTTAEMERNLEAVRELGEEYTKYGKSMASTIDIAARVAATGAQGDALVAGTEQTIRLATLGLMEYDEALDATISLQTAFKVSNEDLTSTIDFLNVVENETILTMQDMAAAIPRVAPVIKGLGGDVKDLAVLMTALREGGVSAEQGANAIKSGLGRLINPTKAAREEMAKYSISIDAIAQKNKGDLMGMLTDFSKALSSLGEFEQQQVLQKVFGTYQYARLGALFKNLANDSGQAARALELTSMSVEDLARVSEKELSKIEEATSTRFQASIEKMKVAIAPIGEQFMKILMPVIDFVTKIADKFNSLPDNIKNAITIAIAAIAGIGPVVLMLVGLFANGIANLVKFVQMIRKFFARIRGDASTFGYLAQKEAEAAAAAAGLSGATDTLTGKFVGQQKALERLIELLSIYSGRLGSVAGMAIPAAPAAGGRAPVAAMPVPAQPRSFFTPMGRPKAYADGVVGVPGRGNKDTVPALLTPGESVVTKSATKKYGSIISAMNAGTIKMMATAGGATGRELPPARSMMMMGGSSYALNPGAIFAPGNQSAFGMSKSFMTRGTGLINSIVGALVGSAMVVEKEAGVISKNAKMTATYFNDMQAEVRPAAEGIAQDIRDTWREMSKAEKESATIDDVIAKARARIQARLVSLSESGPLGAAAAQGASRFLFNPANAEDRAKYGDIRAAATVRTADGKYIDKPLRPGNYGNIERGPSVMSPIKTATAMAYGGAIPLGYQYAHLVSGRMAGPEIPLQGGALGASSAIRSEMMGKLAAYQSRSPLYAFTPEMEAKLRQELARVATSGAQTFTSTLQTQAVAGSRPIIPAVIHQGMGHTANPLFGQAAKDDAHLYTSTLKAEIAKAQANNFRTPQAFPRVSIGRPGMAPLTPLKDLRAATAASSKAGIATVKAIRESSRQVTSAAQTMATQTKPLWSQLGKSFKTTLSPLLTDFRRMPDTSGNATRKGVWNAAGMAGVRGGGGPSLVQGPLPRDFATTVRGLTNGLGNFVYDLKGIGKTFPSIKAEFAKQAPEIRKVFSETVSNIRASGKVLSQNLTSVWIEAGAKLKVARDRLVTAVDTVRIGVATAGEKLATTIKAISGKVAAAGSKVSGFFGTVNERTGQTRGQRIGGAANGAVMGLMGLSMAASFAGGEVGEMAQKIMPVTMGLMGLQMILPMLKSPLGASIIAIGALTAMYVKSRTDLDNLARSAADAGANLGGLANRTQEMSAATGYTFAADRAKDNLFRLAPEDKESMSKFADYFESERGTKFLDNLRKLTSADRYNEVAKMLTMAITDGMDEETAKAYGYSIAYYLGDAVMQQKLKIDFAAGEFAKGIDGLIDIIAERQSAIDALGGYRPVEVGQSSASRGLANMTGIGQFNTQQSMFAEGLAKTGATALAGAGIGALFGGPIGAAIGAVAGTIVGGLMAWRDYNDQVARLNENVGSAAMTMGNAIQVLGELKGAEQLLLEKRQEGKISAEEYANELQRIKDLEGKATANMTSVIESMMMGGQVDTDALQQAMKNQLIFAGFEEGLAGAVSSTITPENIAKALFPGNTLEQVFADQAKKAAVSTVMIQSLAGITPENASQRLSDITSQWAVAAQDLLVAAEDGLTVDEARAVLIGKRAAQIVMDGILSGAEGGVEDYSAGTTKEDYQTAGNLAAKALAGEPFVAPEGVDVSTNAGTRRQATEATIVQNGREYRVTKKEVNEDLGTPLTFRQRIAQDKMPEGKQLQFTSSGMASGSETSDALGAAGADVEKMFGDLEFTAEDQQLMKDYASKFGVGMSDFLSDALADQGEVGQMFRENIQWALEQGEDFDWTQLAGLGELGTSSDEIRTAIQAAFDTSEVKLNFPEFDMQDMGTKAKTAAEEFGDKWASAVASREAEGKLPISDQQAEAGLTAATKALGATGMENIAAEEGKMNVLLDLIAKMNTPEFAGMDMDKAISEVFGKDANADVSTLIDNLNRFEDTYSGVGTAFGDVSQTVIDYFKETAEASKDSGETTEEYIQRQIKAAEGYVEIIKTMPSDMTARLGIDLGDPSTYMELGPHLDYIKNNWPVLSKLDPEIDISMITDLFTNENGEPKSPIELARDIKRLNNTWKQAGKEGSIKGVKKIITEFAMETQNMTVEQAEATWNDLVKRYGKGKILKMAPDVLRKVWNIQAQITANQAEVDRLQKQWDEMPGPIKDTPWGQSVKDQLDFMKGLVTSGEAELAATDILSGGTTDSPSGGSSGSGGKESPIKGFKEDILNMAKLWTDASMNMEKLNSAKMSFAEQVFKGQGIFDKLMGIKGLPKDAIQQILDMGPEGSQEFIKKFTKDGKITAAGKGFLEAQSAAKINQMIDQDRLSNIAVRGRTRAARSLMGESGMRQETFNFIAEDEERLDAYWELKKRANKGDKEAARDLQKFLQLQDTKVKREEKFNDALLTGVQIAQREWSEYADQQGAFFDKAFADIELEENIRFEAEFGMSIADMEYEIKLNEDLIDDHRKRIQTINDEIRALETRNGTAKDYSDWGTEQLQKEIDSNQDLIKQYERTNELTQRKIDGLKREDEIRLRISEELSHELELMSDVETKIGEAYDKRIEALDEVSRINENILDQQRQQIGLSQALSQGDVYGAAAAAQEMQASSVSFASEQVKASLEQGRENELAALRTSGGLTREQAEEKIRQIKEQSYQTSLSIRTLEDEIYNRQINDILPLKDKEYNLGLALEKVQDSINAKQLQIRDIERSKIEPLEQQNAKMREQADDLLLKIEGKQRDIKNEAGQTKDEFEKMNNWMQADLAWQELMTKETERGEQKARDLAAQWKNVGEQIQSAKDALKDELNRIDLLELGPQYTEKDRERDRKKAQEDYEKAVSGYLSSAAQEFSTTWAEESSGASNNNAGKTPSEKARWIMMPGGRALTGQAYDNGTIYLDKQGRFRWKATGKLVPTMPEGDMSKYYKGGMVSGMGSRDSIGAMLSPGEFVIRKSMVDKYGMPMINSINQGAFSLPRYNVGAAAPQMSKPVGSSNAGIIAPVYNTYSISVPVNQPNASADEIAYKVMTKIKSIESANIRRVNGY